MSNPKTEKSIASSSVELSKLDRKEALRLSLIHLHRLKLQTTLEQLGAWLMAKDFDKHEPFLRLYFIKRLEAELSRLSVSELIIRHLLNGETLSEDSSWSDIHSIIISLLMEDMTEAVLDDQDALAEALGFPPDTYADMMGCVEHGIRYEANKDDPAHPIH